MRSATRPSLRTIRSVSRGFISRPPLATAAATSPSGAAWPRPRPRGRPGRSPRGRRRSRPPRIRAARRRDPARDHLAVGVVELRVLVEAVALHVLDERRAADPLADLREHRVHRVRQRVGEARSGRSSAPPAFSSGDAADVPRRAAVDHRLRRDLAAVEGGRGGHDLERRARRIELLRRPVEQRLVRIRVEPPDGRTGSGSGRTRGSTPSRAPCRSSARSPRPRPCGPPGRPPRPAVPATSRFVTTSRPSRSRPSRPEKIDSNSSSSPGQVVVARALEAAPPVRDERVADRLREQPAGRDTCA